jgi:hypothetical protein
VFQKLRDVLGVHILGDDERPITNLGRLFDCVWCLSVWIATGCAVVAISSLWFVMIPFALSAMAIIIEEQTRRDRSK